MMFTTIVFAKERATWSSIVWQNDAHASPFSHLLVVSTRQGPETAGSLGDLSIEYAI